MWRALWPEVCVKTNEPRIIAISSGKGGVGKTNLVGNLALYFAGIGKKTLIIDADLGLSNIDVMLGVTPQFNLKHVLNGSKSLSEIVAEGPMGIKIIPASSGVRELTRLTDSQRLSLLSELDRFEIPVDICLIDTGAGISDNVLFFCSAAQETIVVVTPEPTSIADAYALIKVLSRDFGEKTFRILVNTARSEKEAFDTFRKIAVVTDKFLSLSIDYIGYLPYEAGVKDAIIAQKGYISLFPNSAFAKRIAAVAGKIMDDPVGGVKGGLQIMLRQALRVGN
jgi:flagellar biosynthesis protein FlhG